MLVNSKVVATEPALVPDVTALKIQYWIWIHLLMYVIRIPMPIVSNLKEKRQKLSQGKNKFMPPPSEDAIMYS